MLGWGRLFPKQSSLSLVVHLDFCAALNVWQVVGDFCIHMVLWKDAVM